MKHLIILILSLSTLSNSAGAGDAPPDILHNWQQWRGPLASGAAPLGDPPTRWDATANIKWKAALPGRGSATPIIWGDKIFVLAAADTGRKADPADLPKPDPRFEKKTRAPTTYYRFVVLCFDRQTGKLLWERTATEQVPHEGHHPSHSYAAGSPVTDGQRLYVSFGSRGLYCYDLSGTLLWKRDLGHMNTRLGWGEGTSPALHDHVLIVNWDQEADSCIYALDARTGETRWRVKRDEPTSWSTPAIVPFQGRVQVIVSATNRVRSYDLATGKVIWQCGGQTVNVIPSPIVAGSLVYCMSGYRGSAALALPLGSLGDITDRKKALWHYSKGTPYVPSPLLVNNRLYFTAANDPLLTCLDASTGKPILDRQRLPSLASLYASPVAAAGRIYLVGQDGTTVVLRQGDKFEVLAINRIGDPVDASPAVVGKQLFLRSHKYLYCIQEP